MQTAYLFDIDLPDNKEDTHPAEYVLERGVCILLLFFKSDLLFTFTQCDHTRSTLQIGAYNCYNIKFILKSTRLKNQRERLDFLKSHVDYQVDSTKTSIESYIISKHGCTADKVSELCGDEGAFRVSLLGYYIPSAPVQAVFSLLH